MHVRSHCTNLELELTSRELSIRYLRCWCYVLRFRIGLCVCTSKCIQHPLINWVQCISLNMVACNPCTTL